jgi:hypothetical protein
MVIQNILTRNMDYQCQANFRGVFRRKKKFFRTGWLGSSSSDFRFLLRMVGTCLEAPPVRLFSSERPIRRPDIFCNNREI